MDAKGHIPNNREERLDAWLRETGELLVELYPPLRVFTNIEPHQFGVAFFVHSVSDIHELIAAELGLRVSQSRNTGLCVTVYRRPQYPLQGLAGAALLEQVVRQVPDGECYNIVSLDHQYPPFPVVWLSAACSHAEFEEELGKLAGKRVAIGRASREDKVLGVVPNPEEIMNWSYERRAHQYEFVG